MKVLLLKEPSPEYESAFAGVHTQFLPVLQHDLIQLDRLSVALASQRYAGVIVTSQRAAEALNHCVGLTHPDLIVFAVGPSTADAIRRIPPQRIFGQDAGRAHVLGPFIVDWHARQAFAKPLLFLTGDKTRETLPSILHQGGVPFEELQVYATSVDPALASGLLGLHTAFGPDWLVFFSPSGIDGVLEAWPAGFQGRRIAAIGPTTRDHLEQRQLPCHAVADKPTAASVAQAIEAASTSG